MPLLLSFVIATTILLVISAWFFGYIPAKLEFNDETAVISSKNTDQPIMATTTTTPTIAQFTPNQSQTHPSFWNRLTELKLDILKLSDEDIPIHARYSVGKVIKDKDTHDNVGMNGSWEVDESSFEQSTAPARNPMGTVTAYGTVKNFNTIEEFKSADKAGLFNDCADKVHF
jgi:hypothetical protein